jgi:MFS transporter, PAT family, beta-lactamase induction signal transducer AmpG
MEPLHTSLIDDRPRPPHPFLYALLMVPFGATSGFPTVALGFLGTKHGLTVEQTASLVAVSLFPNVWKFFWAPVADRTLTRKRWYLLSAVACAVGMAGMAMLPLDPKNLWPMYGVIFMTSIAATFLGFAVEAMVAHITPPKDRGHVSGWFQAGNLGGNGIGGGIGLWLLTNMRAPWQAGAILAALMLLCAAPLFFLPDVASDGAPGTLWNAVKHVATDMWQVLKSKEGILCGVLCFVPVGTGAAQGVLTQAEVAAHWGAHEREVGLVQGFLTGGVSMVGCLAGGWVCSRFLGARKAYAVFGGMMAIVTAAMAFAPATVATFIGYNLAYAFVTGLCYAAFTAFVLDAIGKGHAATKYNGFASLSNAPIWYMGLVLARAETKLGPSGMLLTESGFGVVGILIFAAAAILVGRFFVAKAEPDKALAA